MLEHIRPFPPLLCSTLPSPPIGLRATFFQQYRTSLPLTAAVATALRGMSSLRDLVIGNDACTASDGAGPSNALSSLVDNLLGSGKAQEQLQEVRAIISIGLVPESHLRSRLPGYLQLPSMLPQHGVHRLMPGGEASGEEMAKAFAGAGQHLHIPGLAGPPAVLVNPPRCKGLVNQRSPSRSLLSPLVVRPGPPRPIGEGCGCVHGGAVDAAP